MMSRPFAISFALNIAGFCLLLALAVIALIEPALSTVDGSLHDTYYLVPNPGISALFGGAMVLLAASLIVQIRTLRKVGQ